jgi:hypothetical protein
MSLVAVTKDHLQASRMKTLAQEGKIDRSSYLKKWQRSDATKVLMVERLIALAFFPIAVFWALLTLSLSIGLSICLILFRGLSAVQAKLQAKL